MIPRRDASPRKGRARGSSGPRLTACVAGSSPEGKREQQERTDVRYATTYRSRRAVRSLARSFVRSRNFSVLCSRLCMHNELQSRNSLLKAFGFTTEGNNQLTIAYAEKAIRIAPVSSILIAVPLNLRLSTRYTENRRNVKSNCLDRETDPAVINSRMRESLGSFSLS